MPLESASYISQLVSANPSSTDTVAQADDHIRLIKSVLKATFPNLSGPVTSTQDTLSVPVPAGFIGMWSGAIAAIPSGWLLCNGSNGTPDLRDRFVVGAGSTYAVGATGGAASVTLTEAQIPSHTHTVTGTTDTTGSHTHTINDPGHAHSITESGTAGSGSQPLGGVNNSLGTGNTNTAITSITINAAGEHTHSITGTAAATGGSQSHENRPPYYALAYIMKS